ncbi:MAG: zf-HC2 domain-containing protein [Armatimonadetes bacterium]|nr:zf-HC2 domain-containing protein [Armatimonadota bacterium]
MIREPRAQHPRVARMLSAYLDDELAAGDAAAVREHLAECPECRRELGALRATKRLLGALPVRDLPTGFHEALAARIEEATQPAWRRVPHTLWLWMHRPLPAVAVAAVVVLLLAIPLIRGHFDRLHAGEVGIDLYLREHAATAAQEDLLPDRASLHLLMTDSNLVLVGEPARRDRP